MTGGRGASRNKSVLSRLARWVRDRGLMIIMVTKYNPRSPDKAVRPVTTSDTAASGVGEGPGGSDRDGESHKLL